MLIKDEFEVDHPIDRVWAFFDDIPGVAKCLPGTELNEELGPDHYGGGVEIGLVRKRNIVACRIRAGTDLRRRRLSVPARV